MDNARDVRVGQPAPDFTLEDENGTKVKLSDLRGKPVVLIFYPFDWSDTCTKEMCAMRDSWGNWDTTGVRVFGINRDSKHTHKAWKEHLGLSYSLLADLVGDVAKEYGAWNDALHRPDRTTVVIDPQGIVRYVIHNASGTMRDHSDALEVVRAMAVAR